MEKVEMDWLQIVKKVVESQKKVGEMEIEQILQKPKEDAKEMLSYWRSWTKMVEDFGKINWHDEVEKFQILDEMAKTSK